MKIHAYIIAWNEGKILPFTLDYYSQFCENIFVYDNMSTDNTDEICANYPNVKVVKWYTTDMKYNDVILAEMKSNIYKQSRKDRVDWVVMCDCDEYLYYENLLDKLKEYKQAGINMPLIDGHDMYSDDFPEYDGELLTDKIKIGSETYAPMCKNIVFDPMLDIKYLPGAHSNQCHGAVKSNSAEIKLLHYKFLGKEYVITRYNQLAERLSDFNKKNGLSRHWANPPIKYMDEMKEKQYRVI